jgi:very-short-patch-repair endonuclease
VRVNGKLKSNITITAKALRKKSTDSENFLWRHLCNRQLAGAKFRRQQPIDNYVVDFVCFEKRIVVEIDGGQHALDKDKDAARDDYLRRNEFKVLRFWNNEVLANIEGVLEVIRENC